MDSDLDRAIAGALQLDSDDCLARGRDFTWKASARQFLETLACPDHARDAVEEVPAAVREAA